MPDAINARIFGPFFTTKAVDSGNGLGLAVSRQLMDNAGGKSDPRRLPDGGAVSSSDFMFVRGGVMAAEAMLVIDDACTVRDALERDSLWQTVADRSLSLLSPSDELLAV